MSIRTSRWIARSAWVLSVALAALSVPLFVANRSIETGWSLIWLISW
jgi:hypothetical protein